MAHFCEHCEKQFTNPTCPRCGAKPGKHPGQQIQEPLSGATDSLDHMIEQASRPTLASLLKRGIDSGLIKPTHDYAAGSTPTP
jgi:hypothetical protein